jgi:predicted ATP-dependent endonuclease of OLD family
MKIERINLHNFRSIKGISVDVKNFGLLVGENNAGKTSFLTALRMFYEDGGVKFSKDTDFPKFPVDDNESWIEIHYRTSPVEQDQLKESYRDPDGLLRVRRYFAPRERVKTGQSNIYAYEGGHLSDSLFYGAKNISQAKLGSLIYIPEVAKTDEALKLSGPSPLRQILHFVFKRAVEDSNAFKELRTAFESFNEAFRTESSDDGFSISALVDDVNNAIREWQIRFGVDINPVRPEELVKNLLSHHMTDLNLDGQHVAIGAFGQGVQRHLIYTLIRLTAKYVERKTAPRKDFSPDYTLLLFEEPEAFLHPGQQESLNASLQSLGTEEDHQVLATTHSVHLVSRNVEQLPAVVRLVKQGPQTYAFQVTEDKLRDLLDGGCSLRRRFAAVLEDESADEDLKSEIRRRKLAPSGPDDEVRLEEERVRHCLWLNAERAAVVFARTVLLCEGPTEKALLDLLTQEEWQDLRERRVFYVDAMGKFHIHRYMLLLSSLGIRHGVLIDADRNQGIHKIVNEHILETCTEHTVGVEVFPQDLEAFLGISPAPRRDLKPVHALSTYRSGGIAGDKLEALHQKVMSVI